LKKDLDLLTFKNRLVEENGRETWRTLDELAADPSLGEFLHREFPRQASALDSVDRRNFLKLMSASLAMAGLTACERPLQTIVPYVRAPEQFIPGKPLYYATAMTLGGIGTGLLVENHMGRPTKVEGNPDHPGSLGATDKYAQAAILSLYDPDRSQTVRKIGEVSTWSDFLAALIQQTQALQPTGGSGLYLLTETITSPTLGAQIREVLTRFPQARWHQYEPVNFDNTREGIRLALGTYASAVYDFRRAEVVVSLDADFLSRERGHVRYARDFMDRRRVRSDKKTMNRLYVLESMPSPTGAVSDHHFSLKPSEVAAAAEEIAAALGAGAVPATRALARAGEIANDLLQHRGRSIVLAGESQPPAVHALAHQMNRVLGNVGQTVSYTAPLEASPVHEVESLRQLVADMSAGRVSTLIILGGNPVFDAPANIPFDQALEQVRFRTHLSSYYDETSARCHWHIPRAHFLEEWSDTRAYDGTVAIVQPLIAPLYNGRSAHEILGALAENPASAYDIVRNYWRAESGAADFETFWTKALHDGVVANTAAPPVLGSPSSVTGSHPTTGHRPPTTLELSFREDPTIYDGRFANNAWLQELPKPITKITWDNVAMMAPATAARLGLQDEQLVLIRRAGGAIRIPVLRVAGHAEDCITVNFGYGRGRVGRVGNRVGVNAYAIRGSDAMWMAADIEVEATGGRYRIANTQMHHDMEGRDPVREHTLAEYLQNPGVIQEAVHPMRGPTMYPPHPYDGYAWGMTIDTNVCIGCGICTIACQAENNIPVVGKDQVLMGREMHWIRVDHYHKGPPENPSHLSQPIPCMHCENAPCEPVCPVAATSHSDEGLNDMTYNRCIGTRYCANNCPYKVRRFNFFEYTAWDEPSLALMRNPDVTVRSRGVMEKCTYCVQRINGARIEAEKGGRKIRDGEFTTACAQACPTRAIVFGDINDSKSEVSRIKKEPTSYGLLTELNTQPRTTYLPTFRNPNPAVKT
jgi:MoCo/4Fe-4S cofactor protein with predicted Tat translocation signal